jgi:DNA-directed RNA polymerase specialized sigma24 family protein
MKVLNSKSKFSGHVVVNGNKLYVNTSTGAGFKEMFEIMGGTITKIAKMAYIPFWHDNVDEARQDVCLAILEGILKYESDKDAALSTFLYTYAKNKMIDMKKKRRVLLYYTDTIDDNNEIYYDLEMRLDLAQRTKSWDSKWKNIILRLFVSGDKVADVAADENMTPWGLSRAVKRKLKEARI